VVEERRDGRMQSEEHYYLDKNPNRLAYMVKYHYNTENLLLMIEHYSPYGDHEFRIYNEQGVIDRLYTVYYSGAVYTHIYYYYSE
jgi:hypothetical protein